MLSSILLPPWLAGGFGMGWGNCRARLERIEKTRMTRSPSSLGDDLISPEFVQRLGWGHTPRAGMS
jgi:hypothetical protein